MKYDVRHFRKFESLWDEVKGAQEEVDYMCEGWNKEVKKEIRAQLYTAKWELAQYRKTHPGIMKAYNKFIREGGDTF